MHALFSDHFVSYICIESLRAALKTRAHARIPKVVRCYQKIRQLSLMLSIKRTSGRRLFFNLARNVDDFQTYRITKRVNVPPNMLFEVVSDVNKYKDFIPFVTESFVSKYDPTSKLPSEAGFRVGWKEYDELFTCKVDCTQDQRVFSKSLTTLVFEDLQNEWTFRPIKNNFTNEVSTEASLSLKYRFKNPIYNTVASLFQSRVSEIMIEAFQKRAMEMKIGRRLRHP